MKKIALKIFIFTVVCFGLSIALGKFAAKGQNENYWKHIAYSYSKNLDQNYQDRKIEKEIILSKAQVVEIRAISTDINFEKSPDDKIHIVYNARVSDLKPKEILNFVKQDEGKVYIDFDKMFEQDKSVKINIKSLFNFNVHVQDAKAAVQLPHQILAIELKTVSGSVDIDTLKLDSVRFEAVSGDLNIKGNIHSINSETVSGDLKLELKNLDPQLNFNTTSGDVLVEFEANPDIDVKFSSISGEVKISEDLVASNTTGSKNHFKFGKGLSSFNVETVSGDLEIEKVEK